jgi:hypothetical protein
VLSINIIDGVSGIAGSAAFIKLSGLVFLAGQPGDAMVVHLPLAGIGATLGVLSVELRNQPPVQHLPQEDCPQNWREQAGPAASSRAFFSVLGLSPASTGQGLAIDTQCSSRLLHCSLDSDDDIAGNMTVR